MDNSRETNKQKANRLKENYSKWKKDSFEEYGYFVIFNGFKETNKLKNISGNALKLYIYLGLNSNNTTGEVWHGNDTIAKYFNKSERTIRLWMKELDDLKLIKRFQLKFNEESHTFLQPYINSKYVDSSEKYTYTYRLKNSQYREIINLKEYRESISNAILEYIPKCYVKVGYNSFTISSYSPIEKKYLKNINKKILSENKELEKYKKVYVYKTKEGTMKLNSYLFERIKNK